MVGIFINIVRGNQESFLPFLIVHKLPSPTPDAIVPMEFNGHDHLGFAIPAESSVFVCSVQKNLVEQIQDGRYVQWFGER